MFCALWEEKRISPRFFFKIMRRFFFMAVLFFKRMRAPARARGRTFVMT